MSRSKKEDFDFETALTELTGLVEQMEQGGATLEQTLQHFEHGILLVRKCQAALQAAEQKVQLLMEKNGHLTSVPYESEPEQ